MSILFISNTGNFTFIECTSVYSLYFILCLLSPVFCDVVESEQNNSFHGATSQKLFEGRVESVIYGPRDGVCVALSSAD